MKCVVVQLPVAQISTSLLSLAYLKGSLVKHGIECRIINLGVRASNAALEIPLLEKWRGDILSSSADIIVFWISKSNLKASQKIVEMIRELMPSIFIVSTGDVFASGHLKTIKSGLEFSDCVVQDEGESVLPQLIEAYQKSGEFNQVKQVWTLGPDGQPVYSGFSSPSNLEKLPVPNFDDFDLGSFPKKNYLPLLFSKGSRSRSAQNVYQELLHHLDHYKVEGYSFDNDSFFSEAAIPHIDEFCDLTIAGGKILPWSIQSTALGSALSPAFIKKLAKSGLKEIVLENSHRFADHTIQGFANEGISVSSLITYGGPDESEKDFEAIYGWLTTHADWLTQTQIRPFLIDDSYSDLHKETVTQYGNEPWAWFTQHSTFEIRKNRFLLLIDLLDKLQTKYPAFNYGISDPYGIKIIQKWDTSGYDSLMLDWNGLDKARHDLMRKWFNE